MRDINDVLKEKKAELERVTTELEALRLAASLLSEESGEKRRSPIPEHGSQDHAFPKVKVFP